MEIKDIVKNNRAELTHFKDGKLWYSVLVGSRDSKGVRSVICMFPVDTTNKDDIGDATFEVEHKAITLMRYIRKAKDNNELVMLVGN